MALDRFLIAPFKSGLQNDLKPWLIPEDAFEELRNAYVFRGRVIKRFGSYLIPPITSVDSSVAQLSSRLRINIGTTDGSGDLSNNLPAVLPGVDGAIGQMFSIGTEIFTVYQASGAMLTTGSATTHTFTVATGAYVFEGAAATTDVYFYPALPVMGFAVYEQPEINDEFTYAFDTRFAYRYAAQGWTRLGTGAAATWTGDDSEFFWSTSYRGATADATLLFTTNYNVTDKMRYWDGTIWTSFYPLINATDTIQTARIIIPFKDRLLLLNVIENDGANKTYVNRCRFGWDGSPVNAAAFRTDSAGKGGVIDIPTKEAIISAQLLKDRLIVFCERSTWELAYTGNQILPFVFQQINSELGVESSFSIVPFDKIVLGIGDVGIHACDGLNVDRIDQKIPEYVFNIHNQENDGTKRVHGIRDYSQEMVYWCIPTDQNNDKFPRHVLVYNYNNGSWAVNDDSITCFGYLQRDQDLRWEDLTFTWEEWESPWNSGTFQSEFPNIIAGNQEGFTFIVTPQDITRNAPSLQITNLVISGNTVTITAVNNNLREGDYILIENANGITWPDSQTSIIKPILTVTTVDTADDTLTINISGASGTYTGGGTMARVSRIDIKTKQYNFYNEIGENIYIPVVDFLVDNNPDGEVTIDYLPSSSERDMRQDGIDSGAILGTGILETSAYDDVPLESSQNRFWHPFYPQIEGECAQFRIYLSDEQMEDSANSLGGFGINAMLFYTQKVHRK